MKYSDILKSKKIVHLDTFEVDMMVVSCQYNSDRFLQYRQSVEFAYPNVENDVLQLRFSPHVWYAMRYYQDKSKILPINPYSYMQLMYGRSAKDILAKTQKFNTLLDSIKSVGLKEDNLPIVLIHPVIQNKFNGSYEIYEGHHRMAAVFATGVPYCKVKLCTIGD